MNSQVESSGEFAREFNSHRLPEHLTLPVVPPELIRVQSADNLQRWHNIIEHIKHYAQEGPVYTGVTVYDAPDIDKEIIFHAIDILMLENKMAAWQTHLNGAFFQLVWWHDYIPVGFGSYQPQPNVRRSWSYVVDSMTLAAAASRPIYTQGANNE